MSDICPACNFHFSPIPSRVICGFSLLPDTGKTGHKARQRRGNSHSLRQDGRQLPGGNGRKQLPPGDRPQEPQEGGKQAEGLPGGEIPAGTSEGRNRPQSAATAGQFSQLPPGRATASRLRRIKKIFRGIFSRKCKQNSTVKSIVKQRIIREKIKQTSVCFICYSKVNSRLNFVYISS